MTKDQAKVLARVTALVSDDAWAMTFQSLGQYRTALIRTLAAWVEQSMAAGSESSGACPTCGGPWPCDRCTTRNVLDLDALKAQLQSRQPKEGA